MRPQRDYRLLLGWLTLLVLLQLVPPHFDAAWWLRPLSAQWQCQTAEPVRMEHGLAEGFIGYAGRPQGPIWLYSTTVVRDVVCRRDNEELQLHYRDLYLNVSHHDVAGEAARLQVLFPLHQAYTAWRYDLRAPLFAWQPRVALQLDRHGLAMDPLLVDETDWVHWALWLWLKLTMLAMATGLTAAVRYALGWRGTVNDVV